MQASTGAAEDLMQVHASFERISKANKGNMSLDQFQLQRTIGCGRYARVRLATLKSETDIPICLKVFKKKNVHLQEQCEHIINEKDVLASVHNPFIIHMLATFQDVDRLYMALELVNGGELFTLLRERIKFTLPHARIYMAEMICAISHLHSLQICFRDVKPENILIHASGHLKLTDFGFAKYIKGGKTHTVCGTAVYMAPEILKPMKGDDTKSAGYGLEVDWYGLGILFYEMLNGKAPFVASDFAGDQDIFQQTMTGFIRYPPGMDKSATDCIKRLLHREPNFRLGSVWSPYGKVQHHACFASIDWEAAETAQLEPPWKPDVQNSTVDTSFFGTFPESADGISFFGQRRRSSRNSGGLRLSFTNSAFRGWEERCDFREEALAVAARVSEEVAIFFDRKRIAKEAENMQLSIKETGESLVTSIKETGDSLVTSIKEISLTEDQKVDIVRTPHVGKESGKGCCTMQ